MTTRRVYLGDDPRRYPTQDERSAVKERAAELRAEGKKGAKKGPSVEKKVVELVRAAIS